jgi:hypothetical protein
MQLHDTSLSSGAVCLTCVIHVRPRVLRFCVPAAVDGNGIEVVVTRVVGHVRSIEKRMDTGLVMLLHRLSLFLFVPRLLPHLYSIMIPPLILI